MAFHEDLGGGAVPEPETDDPADVQVRVLCVRLETAWELLRRHAGPGGVRAAAQLADELAPADSWCVLLMLLPRGGQGGAQTVGEMLNTDGPSHFDLMLDSGQTLRVFGRTGVDAAIAGALVSYVATRRITLPYEGQTCTFPLTDGALADYLLKLHGEGDGPHQVAEAVAALKKIGKEKRLLQVLRNRPGLQALYRKVRQEMTGEPG